MSKTHKIARNIRGALFNVGYCGFIMKHLPVDDSLVTCVTCRQKAGLSEMKECPTCHQMIPGKAVEPV